MKNLDVGMDPNCFEKFKDEDIQLLEVVSVVIFYKKDDLDEPINLLIIEDSTVRLAGTRNTYENDDTEYKKAIEEGRAFEIKDKNIMAAYVDLHRISISQIAARLFNDSSYEVLDSTRKAFNVYVDLEASDDN